MAGERHRWATGRRSGVRRGGKESTQASEGHLDPLGKEMLQKLGALEPGKRIIPTPQVTKSEGAELESWKLAAEVEMQSNFINMHAVHESTDAERAAHGRPLPMLCVWTLADTHYKRRACVCGNFAEADPTLNPGQHRLNRLHY